MRVSIFFALAITSTASAVCAQEYPTHLEPEDGPFFGLPPVYSPSVVKLLMSKLPTSGDTIVYVMPSFSPEWAISINSDTGVLSVGHAKTNKDSNKSSNPKDVEIKSVIIPGLTATRIKRLIDKHLDQVRYPKEIRMGLDGEFYHFATITPKAGIRYGKTWSPESPPLATLVELVYALEKLPSSSGSAQTEAMQQLSSALSAAEAAESALH